MTKRAPRAILVTGAGSGIGRATAMALAEAGRDVVLTDLSGAGLTETMNCIKQSTGRAMAVVADLTDDAAVEALVTEAGAWAPIGAIVHSAGLFPQLRFADSTISDFDQVMAVNFRAAFVLAKAGVAAMRGMGGALVFLTSGAGLIEAVGDPFQLRFAIYGASKAALDRWALGIARELLEEAIVVTTITPGALVETRGTAAIDRSELTSIPTIAVANVGAAVAWLAREPRKALAGHRLSATQFGATWGPGL